MPRAREEKPEVVERAEAHVGVAALHVYDKTGKYVRTYSAELHGPEFVALAEGFAAKIKGEVRK